MKYFNSGFSLTIRHYGFPINNWGYEVTNSSGEIVAKDMQCGQYGIENAITKGKEEFIKIAEQDE
jgi:hypothetical protein